MELVKDHIHIHIHIHTHIHTHIHIHIHLHIHIHIHIHIHTSLTSSTSSMPHKVKVGKSNNQRHQGRQKWWSGKGFRYSYNNRGTCSSLQVGRIQSTTVSTPFQVSTEYDVGRRLGVSRTPPCWGGSEENPSSWSSSPWGSIMGISGGQWGIQPGVLNGVLQRGPKSQKGGVQSGWWTGSPPRCPGLGWGRNYHRGRWRWRRHRGDPCPAGRRCTAPLPSPSGSSGTAMSVFIL